MLSIGRNCAVKSCRQLDFLPFTCDACHEVYCLEHRQYQSHSCPKAGQKESTAIVCPLCAKAIKLSPDEDPNIAFERHTAEVQPESANTWSLANCGTQQQSSACAASAGLRPSQLRKGAPEGQVPLPGLPREADDHQHLPLQGVRAGGLPEAPLPGRP